MSNEFSIFGAAFYLVFENVCRHFSGPHDSKKPLFCRLHYINTLKQELNGTGDYQDRDSDEMSVVNAHLNELPVKFCLCQ